MEYRLSASTIKGYDSCPFKFYCKISKQEQDENQDNTYGNAGNAVHQALEYYYKHQKDIPTKFALIELKKMFTTYWESYTINQKLVDFDVYWDCVLNGVKLNVKPTHLEYEFKFSEPVDFLGFADVVNNKEHWIGDWKTSTYKASKLRDYKNQLKLYAYCYRREYGVNPTCWVYFNKVDKLFKFKFPDETLDSVEPYFIKLKESIERRIKELDFPRISSRGSCFFCNFKKVCSTDLLREGASKIYKVLFHIKKDKLQIEAAIPDLIHRRMEKHINYELKNAVFIKKAMAEKGIKYDAIKRLYKRKEYGALTSPGYMHFVWKEFKEYCVSKGQKLSLILKDWRDQEIMNQQAWPINPELIIDFIPYKWQKDCIETMLKYRWAGAEVGTGAGKTYVAAELIRRIAGKTLFVIDNKSLLMQTKAEYEKMLGIECGLVGMGKREWEFPVVLATIQTLNKNIKGFKNQLANFNVCIFDEYHGCAAKSYETVSKVLINTKYRFSFSATAKRDDGNTNIIFAVGGEVVYRKKALALIEDGVLVRPRAIFYDYGSVAPIAENWQSEYVSGIVLNEERNRVIKEIAEKYAEKGKQIMILVKDIKNGHAHWLKNNINRAELIYGKTEDDIRLDLIEQFKNKEFPILIGSISIFNKGIDIKVLDVLINVAGNAGEVVTIQSIGRALRKSKGKNNAYYIDFIDRGEYLYKHSLSRLNALKEEGYETELLKY